ncbi:uncharacterized protein LOC120159515 [Hibiscus syriacus]|uniref:uncharacterized protein LOC120159515 n=1 Tax=Hibiscus syriacus TaxID=106335 RepID=UPI001920C657|nr:uncharacterized protein LOC120159515 [Hibiscus syriacus]
MYKDQVHSVGGTDGSNQMLLGSQTQGNADGSMQPNDLQSHPHFGSSTLNQLLDIPTSSQTQRHIGYPPQPSDLVSPHQHLAQNRQPLQRSLSKDQKYRLRLKEKEQKKDEQLADFRLKLAMKDEQLLRLISESGEKDIQLARLKSELAFKDQQLAHLRSENEMLRNNKDEMIAHLISEIEMLRKEITSFIKHNNLLTH